MADPRIKQMKIKTGVCKRIAKEKGYYEKEGEKEQERYDKLKASGGDEYQLRKQMEVIEESKGMVPETNRRLKTAIADLKGYCENEADLAESEEYKEAQKQLEEAQKVVA